MHATAGCGQHGSLTLTSAAEAQMCKAAGAAGAGESREWGLLGVQRRREWGGKMGVGEVREGAPCVVGSRDQGCCALLLCRWEDAGEADGDRM